MNSSTHTGLWVTFYSYYTSTHTARPLTYPFLQSHVFFINKIIHPWYTKLHATLQVQYSNIHLHNYSINLAKSWQAWYCGAFLLYTQTLASKCCWLKHDITLEMVDWTINRSVQVNVTVECPDEMFEKLG